MKYSGPQNVDALLEVFDAEYTSQKRNAKPSSSAQVETIDKNTKDPRIEWIQQRFFDKTISAKEYIGDVDLSKPEYFAFKSVTQDGTDGQILCIEYTLGDVDEKYPRHEWLQMLLDKGVRIEDYKDYEDFLDIRKGLFSKEYLADDDVDKSELTAYIDEEIQKYQTIQGARHTNPDVKNWTVIGENALPSIPGRMYVSKIESGFKIKSRTTSNEEPKLSEKQKTDLQNKGVEPEEWEVVYIDEKGYIL